MRALGLPMMALALLSMLGGHYAIVQTMAWATMLWSYSQEGKSLLAGAEKTFSGEAPCPRCRAVKSSREREEQKAPTTVKVEKKSEVTFAFREITAPLPPSAFLHRSPVDCLLPASWEIAPPTPVPLA